MILSTLLAVIKLTQINLEMHSLHSTEAPHNTGKLANVYWQDIVGIMTKFNLPDSQKTQTREISTIMQLIRMCRYVCRQNGKWCRYLNSQCYRVLIDPYPYISKYT